MSYERRYRSGPHFQQRRPKPRPRQARRPASGIISPTLPTSRKQLKNRLEGAFARLGSLAGRYVPELWPLDVCKLYLIARDVIGNRNRRGRAIREVHKIARLRAVKL